MVNETFRHITLEFPEAIMKIAQDADNEHPDNSQTATEAALVKLSTISDKDREAFYTNIELFVMRQLIYRCRDRRNRDIRQQTSSGHSKQKVFHSKSETSKRIHSRIWVFDYCVNGISLGNVQVGNLLHTADSFERKAKGNQFSASLLRLCHKYASKKSPDKSLKDAIPKNRLNNLVAEADILRENHYQELKESREEE